MRMTDRKQGETLAQKELELVILQRICAASKNLSSWLQVGSLFARRIGLKIVEQLPDLLDGIFHSFCKKS
jgi:hypothetical protein